MKKILFGFILTLLATGYTYAQTLLFHNDSISVTEDTVTFQAGKFRGTIQWQFSSDGQEWNDLFGKTDTLLRIGAFDEGYYRAEIKEEACFLVYSDTVQLIPAPCVNDIVEFTVTVPVSVDPNNIFLTIPPLKYNKKLVTSWTIDDNLSVWNLYCVINHKPIGAWPNFHLGDTGGSPGTKALEYTDGAGIKHRFAITVAVFEWLLILMGRDAQGEAHWVTPKELRIAQDFGFTTAFHDVRTTGIGESSFNDMIASNGKIIRQMTGRFPKTLIEPNGDHSYIANANGCNLIKITTAQEQVVTRVKPFSQEFTLEKGVVCVKRDFYNSNLLNYFLTILADQASGVIPEVDRTWLVGGNHLPSAGMEQAYYQQVETLYGASGNDSIWFPSLDEMYEYWFMRKNTTVTKTIDGQNLTFRLDVPKSNNFWFRSLSVLLSGITDTTGVKVSSSDNCQGTSYAVNDGKLLVNLDFNPDLITKVEKYMAIFESSLNSSDKEDAQYFIQMLKPGVKEAYQDRLDMLSSAPVLKNVSINVGADTTTCRAVSVAALYSGSTTSYMISEDSTFTGVSWIPFVTKISVTLTDVEGNHTVYLKLKNIFGESNVVSDSIFFLKVPLSLHSISINNGDSITKDPDIDISLDLSGDNPLYYMISEDPELKEATWIAFTSWNINYTLSSTLGIKTVYLKVKTASEETIIKSDAILLAEATSLSSVSIDSGAINTISQSVIVSFTYKGTPTHYMLSENADFSDALWIDFDNPVHFDFSSGYGVKTIYAKIKDADVVSSVSFDTITFIIKSAIGRKLVISPVLYDCEYEFVTIDQGIVINRCPVAQYEGYENYFLKDVSGIKWGTRIVKPSQLPEEMTNRSLVLLKYRNPVLSGNTGPYPDIYMAVYFGINMNTFLYPAKSGLRFVIEEGTYSVNVLFSTNDTFTNNDQSDILYEANDVSSSPSGIMLNNTNEFVKLENVVVGSDGILDFYISQKTGMYAGFNLLEIVKTK